MLILVKGRNRSSVDWRASHAQHSGSGHASLAGLAMTRDSTTAVVENVGMDATGLAPATTAWEKGPTDAF